MNTLIELAVDRTIIETWGIILRHWHSCNHDESYLSSFAKYDRIWIYTMILLRTRYFKSDSICYFFIFSLYFVQRNNFKLILFFMQSSFCHGTCRQYLYYFWIEKILAPGNLRKGKASSQLPLTDSEIPCGKDIDLSTSNRLSQAPWGSQERMLQGLGGRKNRFFILCWRYSAEWC